jgi:hypothetical protein
MTHVIVIINLTKNRLTGVVDTSKRLFKSTAQADWLDRATASARVESRCLCSMIRFIIVCCSSSNTLKTN